MGKITRNYAYNLAYQLLVLVSPLITAPYLVRVLGATNLGIYGYIRSSSSIITGISLLGILAYGNRLTAYIRDQKSVLTKAFWELEITHVILCIIGSVFYFVYASFHSEYYWYFLIYYPYVIAQFIDCSWLYVGLEDMRPAVIRNFITRIVNIVGVFVLVRSKDDVWIYILMLAVTTMIGSISIYAQLPKYIGRPCGDGKPEVRRVFYHIKGALYLFLPQVASLFYLQVDKVMIEWLTGESSQLAYYDNAERIINIPLAVITVIGTVMMPRLANEFKKNNTDIVQSLLIKSGRYALIMTFPLMIGVFCVARQFIPWYLGIDFFPTAIALMILSPIVLFNSLSNISGAQYFTATDQIGILLKAYVSAAILNMIANVVLIPNYGYAGASIATVGSSLISVVIQFFYLNKQINVSLLIKYSLKYLLCGLLMGSVIYLVTRTLPPNVLTTLLQIAIGCVIYPFFLFVIHDEVYFEIIGRVKKMFR